jgi:hypothetical protein
VITEAREDDAGAFFAVIYGIADADAGAVILDQGLDLIDAGHENQSNIRLCHVAILCVLAAWRRC